MDSRFEGDDESTRDRIGRARGGIEAMDEDGLMRLLLALVAGLRAEGIAGLDGTRVRLGWLRMSLVDRLVTIR